MCYWKKRLTQYNFLYISAWLVCVALCPQPGHAQEGSPITEARLVPAGNATQPLAPSAYLQDPLVEQAPPSSLDPSPPHYSPEDWARLPLPQPAARWKWVVPPLFDGYGNYYTDGPLTPLQRNGQWGAINGEGQVIVPFLYNSTSVLDTTPQTVMVKRNSTIGLVDASGRCILPLEYDSCSDEPGELIIVSKGAMQGVINPAGEFVIPLQQAVGLHYLGSGLFTIHTTKEGPARVVNAQGQEVQPARFDWVNVNYTEYGKRDEATYIASHNGKQGVMNARGELVLPMEYDEITWSNLHYFLWIKAGKKWGIASAQGQVIVPPRFDSPGIESRGAYGCESPAIYSFSPTGVAAVKEQGLWGFIDVGGQVTGPGVFVTPPRFTSVDSLGAEGFFLVNEEGKQGAVNSRGEVCISPQFAGLGNVSDTLIPAKSRGVVTRLLHRLIGFYSTSLDGEWGYINQQGDWVIAPQFERAEPFNTYGFAWVRHKERWGVLNQQGQFAIPPQLGSTGKLLSKNLLAVIDKKRLWGLMDTQGNEIAPAQFTEVPTTLANGLVLVETNTSFGLLDASGSYVLPLQEGSVRERYMWNESTLAVLRNDLFGILSLSGEWLVKPRFTLMEWEGDHIEVHENDKWGILDELGQELLPIEFDRLYSTATSLVWVEKDGLWGCVRLLP